MAAPRPSAAACQYSDMSDVWRASHPGGEIVWLITGIITVEAHCYVYDVQLQKCANS